VAGTRKPTKRTSDLMVVAALLVLVALILTALL
jgi:hypothetical protein